MLKRGLYILLSSVALLTAGIAHGQYYDWGVDPASIRWNQLRSDSLRILYPAYFEAGARRAMLYFQSVMPDISYGFDRPALRNIPVVMHTENFASNGLVIWAPKRIELLTVPSVDTYAMPWLKQLAAHEYRHAVQYNNLNRHTLRVFYYLLGQQGAFVSLMGLPLWALEGDAVMAETQMSSFGRGLQPSFSMAYRAAGDAILERRNIDKWFCGSYREYIPDHYELGYQLSSYGYNRYGKSLWNDVADYASRYPFLIATTDIALKKYYGTGVKRLFHDTFNDLLQFWHSRPEQHDSASKIETPFTSYTTYTYPQAVDSTHILALKSDFDRHNRFVLVDTRTGDEQTLAYVGSVSTRPTLLDGRVWWTEYRRSTLWDQRYNSKICWMDLDSKSKHTVSGLRQTLYPTPTGRDSLAWVEYDYTGIYSIVTASNGAIHSSTPMPEGVQLHGLAWDNASHRFYFIALDDDGMWIGSLGPNGETEKVTQPSYSTLSDLRAADGRLYFGSIASGKDEVHLLDLASGQQRQLSVSKYGSFDPAPLATPEGPAVVMTVYDRNGYHLAMQQVDSAGLIPVAQSRLPQNTVNPPRDRWPVVNLDTVKMTVPIQKAQQAKIPAKRYRKGLNYFNAHSWAPFSFDVFDLMEDYRFDPQLGATIVSQNLLSSTSSFLTYAWNRSWGSMVRTGIKYYALGPHFELEGQYGGGKQPIYKPASDLPDPNFDNLKTFFTITGRISMPMQIGGGYHIRYLTPSVEWQHYNGLMYSISDKSYYQGVNKMTTSLYFGDNVRTAYRDFMPRWAYAVKITHTFNPTDSDFGQLLSIYGQVIMPGLFMHHSLRLRSVYQFSEEDKPYAYYSQELYPRGARYDYNIQPIRYVAGAIDYQLPISYPEGGIPSVLYIKRIRLNLGFYYACSKQFSTQDRKYVWNNITSYGADLLFDVNLFRMPDAATCTLKLSLYKPSNRHGIYCSAGVGLPF